MVSIVNTHRGTKARNSRYRYLPTLLALIAVVTWASVLIAWMQSSLEHPQAASQQQPQQQQQQQQEKQRVVDRGLPAREIELFPDDLQHQAFFATLKSCLPADKKSCKQFIPESGIERIGILSPPGALGFVFETFIDEVMRLHPSNHSIEIVKTAHVPPYGYGKTHGYTKLIRLASLPLQLAATDLVLEQVTEGTVTTMDEITLEDISQALRQVVRWQCRLSHVAAHTAIMTISLEDLLEDPWEEEYQVRVFLNLIDEEKNLQDHLLQEKHIDEDELAGSMDEIVHRSTLLLMRLDQMNHHGDKIEDLMDAIINEELKTTKNLAAWPCKSFWELDGITEISKRTAKLFAPNCTSSTSNCWVPRDLCEAQGDAKCTKQNK